MENAKNLIRSCEDVKEIFEPHELKEARKFLETIDINNFTNEQFLKGSLLLLELSRQVETMQSAIYNDLRSFLMRAINRLGTRKLAGKVAPSDSLKECFSPTPPENIVNSRGNLVACLSSSEIDPREYQGNLVSIKLVDQEIHFTDNPSSPIQYSSGPGFF